MNLDLSRAHWRKNSYSGNTGNCVEVATADAIVGVRDSKTKSDTMLVISEADWQVFVWSIKHGKRLNHSIDRHWSTPS